MALRKFDQEQCEVVVGAFIEQRRPPAHVRSKLDLGFRVTGRDIEIFETVPQIENRNAKLENSVAKVTYLKSRGAWRIYWQRGNLKWQSYDPIPEVDSLEEALGVIDEDKHGCFWG